MCQPRSVVCCKNRRPCVPSGWGRAKANLARRSRSSTLAAPKPSAVLGARQTSFLGLSTSSTACLTHSHCTGPPLTALCVLPRRGGSRHRAPARIPRRPCPGQEGTCPARLPQGITPAHTEAHVCAVLRTMVKSRDSCSRTRQPESAP